MKNLKTEMIVIRKEYTTQKENWNNNLCKVTFIAKDFNKIDMSLLGSCEIEYKDIKLTLDILNYEIGGDIRNDILKCLKSTIEVSNFMGIECNNEKTLYKLFKEISLKSSI